MYLLATEVTGFFSFLTPIIELLEDLGHYGLAIYTFFEVLLIIPPIEVIYYPLIITNPDVWYLFLINVVFFNIIASALGYVVGSKIGYPVLKFFSNEEILGKAHELFEKWGVLAVAIGAFTPIPYTIVVFLGGITKMNFKKFMIAGVVGRVPRYVLGGYVIVYILQEVNLDKIDEYMLILSVIGMLLFIVYYIIQGVVNIYRKRQRA